MSVIVLQDALNGVVRKTVPLGKISETLCFTIPLVQPVGCTDPEEAGVVFVYAQDFVVAQAGGVLGVVSVMNERVSAGMKKEQTFHFENSTAAAGKIRSLVREGDLILVKGSRGMMMEKVIEQIKEE